MWLRPCFLIFKPQFSLMLRVFWAISRWLEAFDLILSVQKWLMILVDHEICIRGKYDDIIHEASVLFYTYTWHVNFEERKMYLTSHIFSHYELLVENLFSICLENLIQGCQLEIDFLIYSYICQTFG